MPSQIANDFRAIYPIKKTPQICNLKDVVSKYGGQKSIAPPQFQRPSCWSPIDQKKYFSSVLMDRVEGSFVFVDLILSIYKLESLERKDNPAYDLFINYRSKGYEHLILDANNRLKWSDDLLNDKWTIPAGDYQFVDDNTVHEIQINSKCNKFSTLPDFIKRIIENRQIIVSEYTQIDFKGLSEVFLNVNSGVPLVDQEKRNAFGTQWADYVRKLRDDNSELMAKIMGRDYMKRLKGDNWIVDTLCFIRNVSPINVTGIADSTKNSLYKNSNFNLNEVKQFTDNFNKLDGYLSKMTSEDILPNRVITRPVSCMNLLWMMCNGIDTYAEAVEAVVLHEKYYQDKQQSMNDNGRNYQWACGSLRPENNEIRMRVISTIIDEVKSKGYINRLM